MVVTDLKPIDTTLRKLQEIPETFFSRVEASRSFDNSLFPEWLTDSDGSAVIFSSKTELRNLFKSVFDKYKAILDFNERTKIIDAFNSCNQIIDLCSNDLGSLYIEINDIDNSISEDIVNVFQYLYTNALNHPDFLLFSDDNLKDSLTRFTEKNDLDLCPFCGLETMIQLKGQPRLALDHWLNKSKFPFASINFDNLVPIGNDCNSSGVKGSKNVLKASDKITRAKSYYPYIIHNGLDVTIVCVVEPNITNLNGEWKLSIKPKDIKDSEIFISWLFIFNVIERYEDYLNKIVLRWKKDYVQYFTNDDKTITHADNVLEFKRNLTEWRRSFVTKKRHGSVVYKPFLDCLLNANDDFLYGIVENFKSQSKIT